MTEREKELMEEIEEIEKDLNKGFEEIERELWLFKKDVYNSEKKLKEIENDILSIDKKINYINFQYYML